ncbi:MAG TPA: lytic transglycosylase domain-containing protein [Pseudolabrys sp.]|nr:lytic transglycosylase domain-containing protein [Pseudolabrys sp.]
MAVLNVSASPPQIAGAIRQAAATTGTSFEYLLTTAQIESKLNPGAQAPTSSAGGLYQFIDQTWLATVKNEGAAFGLGRYAQAIVQGPDGRFDVPNPAARTAIMGLRNNPQVSAMMAGAFTRNNASQLAASLGRKPSEAELYVAHFLGAEGAGRLIAAATSHPRADAAAMFPQAAAANRAIFYDGGGQPRSASQVLSRLTGRFDLARSLAFAPPGTQGTPDPAGMTQAFAAANAPPAAPDNRPLFESIFTDRVGFAVAPGVSSLWSPAGAAAPAGSATPAADRPLDLFTDGKPNLRGMFGAS